MYIMLVMYQYQFAVFDMCAFFRVMSVYNVGVPYISICRMCKNRRNTSYTMAIFGYFYLVTDAIYEIRKLFTNFFGNFNH